MRSKRLQRREFITLIGGAAATWSLAARAQQSAMPAIGLLDVRSPDAMADRLRGLRQGLGETRRRRRGDRVMRRRGFMSLLGGAAVTWPIAARAAAHDASRRPRPYAAWLGSTTSATSSSRRRPWRPRVSRYSRGWVCGDNASGQTRSAPAIAVSRGERAAPGYQPYGL